MRAGVVAISAMLAGCAAMTNGADQARTVFGNVETRSAEVLKAAAALTNPASRPVEVDDGRVKLLPGKFIPTQRMAALSTGAWLRDIGNITLSSSARGIAVSQIVAVLGARGVNVVSDLPLHAYIYSGTINPTDAENFLKIVTGSVGLDFIVDDVRRIVTIRPTTARSWYFNMGNRKTAYSTGAGTDGSVGAQTGQQGTASNGIGMPGGVGGASDVTGSDGTLSVSTSDKFWETLEAEIKTRMTIMVPQIAASTAGAGATPMPLPLPLPADLPEKPDGQPQPIAPAATVAASRMPPLGASTAEGGVVSYTARTLGSYAINADSGAVTVQAPTWVLKELDSYFSRVQSMYNAEISFEGQLILITNDDKASEGFDVQGFAKWLGGKYSFLASNNPLGGVTLSFPKTPDGVPFAAPSQPVINGPTLGINRPDGLRLFNSYLQERGQYSIIQRPALATTSGVPAEFKKTTTRYFNTVTQETSSSTNASAVATKNVINAIELGTILKVNPRMDMSTGMVRTQLLLTQVTQTGEQKIPQTITAGNATQTYVASIPLVTRLKYDGETLMKDGDLIIVGGQQEESANLNENGLPGTDGPNIGGGLTGTRSSMRGTQTYYFALQVRINKRK